MGAFIDEGIGSSGASTHALPFSEAVTVWARVAALSFGGPAGQIAVMQRIIVEEKRWIGEERFLHALNYCTLLPGPEAQQLAIYIGWLLHKTRGGLVAGTLFVLPGAVAIMALSWIYAIFGNVGPVQALFFGLKAAVLAIVLGAVLRIGRRSLKNNVMSGLAAAFVALAFFRAPFPLVVVIAGLIGFVGGKAGWRAFSGGGGHGKFSGKLVADADSLLGEGVPEHSRPNAVWLLKVAAIGAVAWLGPIALLFVFLGQHSVFSDISVFFSKMAMVTFGGAYAVLSYVAQEAVNHYGWLKPGEMLDGLGLAETTPGPLIMVTQFVGFMGAYRAPGGLLSPLLAGTLGGLLTTWVTFVPCFLWILLGAPFMESLRRNKALSAALAAITAAVVGIILNLAVWFALHVLFSEVRTVSGFGMTVDIPVLSSVNIPSLFLTVAAVVAVFRFKIGLLPVLAASALAGLVYGLAFGVHP
ncbi:chromate transporter [Rhizobium wenxiniae]|uniref:Chromate transporter n=1 Tax=Rhizobium wenxiniae TaxID=1737357 RepID=A0A7X0D326_9HYPH|nr:chromate efflux transporter [Rhizobium wenxiniae]MBB6166164.1 chromate transporter [Rhizobium wenxiniae]GGG21707.1 chromate transporter [Rhizobium wenxiniae]